MSLNTTYIPEKEIIKKEKVDIDIIIFYLLLLYIISLIIFILIRDIIKQRRLHNRNNIIYDIELRMYNYISCFDIKKFPNITFDEIKCSICHTNFENNEIIHEIKKCHHPFHFNCINEWLNIKILCPICKIKIIE